MLQKAIDAAEGDGGAAEEKSEMEELKQLLPEIREKVEDAKESLRTASAASQAIQQTLVSMDRMVCRGCLRGSKVKKQKCHAGWNLVFISIPP